jgi:endonuclease/exonuclease/phosphatase family metal-dependent hydrolase
MRVTEGPALRRCEHMTSRLREQLEVGKLDLLLLVIDLALGSISTKQLFSDPFPPSWRSSGGTGREDLPEPATSNSVEIMSSSPRARLLPLCAAFPLVALCTAGRASAQGLPGLSFGQAGTFDVVTWNIERFPKNGNTTVDAVAQVIEALDVEVLALQEIDDPSELQQIVDGLDGYEAYYDSSWYAGLAYVYDADTVQIDASYEIYTTQPYWSAFPRSPLVLEVTYEGVPLVIINNHFKCCGDEVLDLSDSGDEETRRYTASNLLEQYIAANFAGERVILLGDLNDNLPDDPANNVFQVFLDAPASYRFADWDIAWGTSANWSYPTWPSHLDHILVTDELFDALDHPSAEVRTIRVEDHLSGGWSEYDSDITDHRPVGVRLALGNTCGFQLAAAEVVRNGTPPNPAALLPGVTSPPVVGAFWDPVVDHSTFMPGAIADYLGFSTAPLDIPTEFGTLLCGPALFTIGVLAGQPFSIKIPLDCSFVGVSLCTQVASWDGPNLLLTNALDITIGSH